MSFFTEVKLVDKVGELYDVHNPLPTNGDFLYSKDVDYSRSDFTDWTGNPEELFTTLSGTIQNSTVDNPKDLVIYLNKLIVSDAIALSVPNAVGNFSNIRIYIKDLDDTEKLLYDGSTDSTDISSLVQIVTPYECIGFRLEFLTSDTVTLGSLVIPKILTTVARIQGLDRNDIPQNVQVTADGDLNVSDQSSGLAIAEGNVTGKTFIHKFGLAPDFDTTDLDVTIWDGADDNGIDEMVYTYSTSGIIDSISSSDNTDVQDIEISGLDSTYALVTQTATLSGQTRVALDTNLLRVFRMKNVGSVDLVGNVYCYENTAITLGVPDDTSKIRSIISNGNNQTLMALYTVPDGFTAYMRDWYTSAAGGNKNSNYAITLKARPFGQVFQTKHVAAISDIGSSYIQHRYEEPEIFHAKTDIEMTVQSLATPAAVGCAVAGGFDIVLIAD